MRTKNKISLLYKSIYGIILLGLFCAAFGVTGLSTARAQQQVATATPTAHTQVHKSSLDGERDSDDAQVGPESLAAANAPELSESSISVPYLSQYTGANTQNVDCGPATVAMVTMAYGKHSVPPSSNSPEARAFIADIRAKMGAIGISGTSNQQRINALAAYGINSTAITSSTPLQTIKDAIAQGRLSIARVLGRTLGRNYDGHVVVVLGFSADFATVYVNDPDNQSRYLNTSTPGGANRAWATSTFEAAMIAAHDSGGYSYYGLVVNNSLATYSATYVTQSPYPTVVQGQSIDLSVTFQNTGNLSWSNTGANPANLGTINPNNISVDYPSPFVCPSWLWGWRPTHMTESTVVPGSNATFNFKICVPANIAPGTYRIAVAPLIEQVTWMFQPGVVVYWDITVTSGTGTDCGHVAYTGVILYQNIICNKDASGTTKAFSSPTDWIDTVSDFNDITSSIYISPGWSIKVFQDSLEQGGGSWRCLTGSMWDLRIDSYTNGDTGRVINDDISSVQIYNQNNCQSGKPDLIPSPLEGRDDPIVISSVLETNTNDTLYAGQPIYIDWGYTNIGTLDITNTNYYVDLYIDNEQQIHYPFTWLGAGAPGGFDDWGITWNTPGWHTVKLIVDPENTIAESNENNNVWEKQFYWNPSGQPDLIPSPLEGRQDPVVISSIQGTNTNDTLYVGKPIYIDWGYTNVGSMDVIDTDYHVDLYIDNEQQIHYPFTWLGVGAQGGFDDWGITWNTPGWHTVKLIVDPENTIAESNENNNVWEKQFYWKSPQATKTFFSMPAVDGWVLESSEKSNKGGTLNTTATTFNLGDNAAKKQYIGILSFNTGVGLPDTAVVTAVTLKMKKSAVIGGGDPVTLFGGFMLDIGLWGTPPYTLQPNIFQAAAGKYCGPYKTTLINGWYNINLVCAKDSINKYFSDLTQIRLHFKLDDNNNTVANYLSLFSGNAPAASRPQLIITYYMP